MIVTLDENAKKTIETIIKRGNDARVRRRGNGVVVLEEKAEIKYCACPNGDK